jgi:hypothetical protein
LQTHDHRVCFDGVSTTRRRIRLTLLERREMERRRRTEIDGAPAVSQALIIVVMPDTDRRRIDRVVAA